MSKAQQNILDALATITGNTSHLVSTIDQLRKEASTQRAKANNLVGDYKELCQLYDKATQRADTAESELATLRRQVDALFASRQAFGAHYQQSSAVYGQGAGDLDTRDNGLVQHGAHAE